MGPVTKMSAEALAIVMAMADIEQRAADFVLRRTAAVRLGREDDLFTPEALADHMTDVAGVLADALDVVRPGMGRQWMQCLHPHLDLSDEATDEAVAAIVAAVRAGAVLLPPEPDTGTDTGTDTAADTAAGFAPAPQHRAGGLH